MEREHEPGCDRLHTARQACRVPKPVPAQDDVPTPGEVAAERREPSEPRRPPEPATLSRERVYAALGVELFPGVLFVMTVVLLLTLDPQANIDWVFLLMMLSTLGGVGWLVVLRVGTGCSVLVLRLAAAFLLFVLLIEAFTNDSTCYRMLQDEGCWERAIQNYHIVFMVFLLMPIGSAALLWRAARRHPWRRDAPLPSRRLVAGVGRGVIAGLVVLIAAPALLGWMFDRSSIGQASLVVVNDTDEQMLAYYRPGYAPGEYIDPGARGTLRPLIHRFERPRTVTFVVDDIEGISTYWECGWGHATRHQPLIINDDNDTGCRKFTIDPSDYEHELVP
jgi:hypothetical protein